MIIETPTTRSAAQANATAQASTWQKAAHAFFATHQDTSGLVLRLALALTMFPHGAQKALGWFGGFGFSKTVGFFVSGGMPAPLAVLVIAAEFLGSIALVLGFFTRWSAFGIGLVMLGAVGMVHSHNGFFMNWMGNQKGEGIEYFIPVIAIALVLIVNGGGRFALDSVLAKRIFKGSRA
jgi:putative oxidoreductase